MGILATAIPTIAGYLAPSGSTLASLATAAQIGGTILSGLSAIQSVSAGNQQAKMINAAAVQSAGQERAKSHRVAEEQRRLSSVVQSRARAVAGASGGGVTDPTVVDITSELAGEGEYRALTAMYEGEDRARGIINQGQADAYTARQKGQAGFVSGMSSAFSGATSMLSGGSSLFDKYAAKTRLATRSYQTPFGIREFTVS